MMDIPTQITNLMTQLSALPNSKARNKLSSKLDDCLVWAKELEQQYSRLQTPVECTCPDGGVRRDCPIHSKS